MLSSAFRAASKLGSSTRPATFLRNAAVGPFRLLWISICTSRLPHLVHVDVAVCGPCEERVAICAPGKRHTPWDPALWWRRGCQLVQDILVLQVPNLDGGVRRGHQPIILGAEAQRIDRAARIQRVEVLSVIHIPEDGCTVLSTGGAK